MNVDIEFFSENPMDNVLACLKFAFSKVIFLGYTTEAMDKAAKSTVAAFLSSPAIGVKDIQFISLPEGKLEEVERCLEGIVETERTAGNQCFFDLTGGEELILAAAGAVADRAKVPMHEIDLAENDVRILTGEEAYEQLGCRDYRLDIEEYVNLHEGVIEWNRQKNRNRGYKNNAHRKRVEEFEAVIEKIGIGAWNKISLGLANYCSQKLGVIGGDAEDLKTAASVAAMSVENFKKRLLQLKEEGLLKSCSCTESGARLEFFSEEERNLLCDPGAVLEHLTYFRIMRDPEVNDCAVGYHLNWVGEGDPDSIYEPGPNVLNEIDVIYMKHNIPTFVSCKNMFVDDNKPLYELETVADRFGGKLVHKVLVAKKGAKRSVYQRADEMHIRVVKEL